MDTIGALLSAVLVMFETNQPLAIAMFGWLITLAALGCVSVAWYKTEVRHAMAYKAIGDRHDQERQRWIESQQKTNDLLDKLNDIMVEVAVIIRQRRP